MRKVVVATAMAVGICVVGTACQIPMKSTSPAPTNALTAPTASTSTVAHIPSSNCQYLWIKIFYAAASFVVASSGRSMSLPFSNFAPARTSATRCGALTARQRDWAASISL